MKLMLLEYLMTGKRYTGKQLGDMIGVNASVIRKIVNASVIRKIVNDLRCNGIPVCSCKCGYYMSNDESDILETINSMERRVEAMVSAINGLKECLGK